jgi:hypothetical protein
VASLLDKSVFNNLYFVVGETPTISIFMPEMN